MSKRRGAAAEAARRLMEGFSPRSSTDMQKQQQEQAKPPRAVDESDLSDDE